MKRQTRRQVSPRANRLNSKHLESHMRTSPRFPSKGRRGVWEPRRYKSRYRKAVTPQELSAKQHFRLVCNLENKRKRVDSQKCLRSSNPTNALFDGTRNHTHTSIISVRPGAHLDTHKTVHLNPSATKPHLSNRHLRHNPGLGSVYYKLNYSRSCRSLNA